MERRADPKSNVSSELGDILNAVAKVARLYVAAPDAHTAFPEVLEVLARSVVADRGLYMSISSRGPAPRDHSFNVEQEWVSDRTKVIPIAGTFGSQPIPFVGEGFDFTRRLELLQAGKPVVYGSLRVLPENETALAQKVGTRSSMRLPVTLKGSLIGMLGFDHVLSVHPWRADELHAMWLAAELSGRAMERFGTAKGRPEPPSNATAHPLVPVFLECALALFADHGWRAAVPKVLDALATALYMRRATWWVEEFGAVRLVQEWHAPGVDPLPATFRDPGLPAQASTFNGWSERNRCYVPTRGKSKGATGFYVFQTRRMDGLRSLPIGGFLQPIADLTGAAMDLAARRAAKPAP